jgi:hypothetical protein
LEQGRSQVCLQLFFRYTLTIKYSLKHNDLV